MRQPVYKSIATTALMVLFALWAMLFYQLVFTGWTIEYSVYGVLAVALACGIYIYAFPRKDRTFMVRFGLFCLIVSLGVGALYGQPKNWTVIDFIVFCFIVLVLGRIFIKIRLWQLAAVILAVTLAEVWVPLQDQSVLSAFSVRYIGHFASQDKQVPSLPVAAVPDPTRPGYQEIITLRAHAPQPAEAQSLFDALAADPAHAGTYLAAIEQIQHSYDVISIRPDGGGFHVGYAGKSELAELPSSSLGLIDFPFTTSHFLTINGQTRMYAALSDNPGQLLSILMNPGTLADSVAAMSIDTAKRESSDWMKLTGRGMSSIDGLTIRNGYLTGEFSGRPVQVKTTGVALLRVVRLLPAAAYASPQAVVEGNNVIQVIALPPARPRVIATLRGTFAVPLTTDVVFADALGKGYDELLVNSVPAQILQLTPAGGWKRLWVSGRSSFRFETAFPGKPGQGDLLIANAPSLENGSPIRYLGGYHFVGGQLVPAWRAYHNNLTDLHTVYVSSRTRPELLTSVYAHQEILLLAPSRIPWLMLTEAVYILIVLVGLGRRLQERGARA